MLYIDKKNLKNRYIYFFFDFLLFHYVIRGKTRKRGQTFFTIFDLNTEFCT